MRYTWYILLPLLCLSLCRSKMERLNAAPGETSLFLTPSDLAVLEQPAKTMMRDYLTAIVDRQFRDRAARLASLKTAEDWKRHAETIRTAMANWTGAFPPRTPLNARVTGKIERQGYSLEKILFESRPGFTVSANLYVPRGHPGPRPAVLNVIGHSPAGKATEKVQRRSIAQARKGFVAFTVDAIGQGERQVPEYSESGRPPGNAHQIAGTQAFLAGTHIFQLMVWDVIRSVDYLTTRPEVDPQRIGCTGCSGGGMLTTYVLPFEPRITVAVPACNPNTWSHRVHANLATDHEQVFFGAFEAGIDPRGDPLFAHVPKPLLINATTNDSLNPTAGVWELSRWLDNAYAAHGQPHKFDTSMIKGTHGYSLEQREVAYAWFLKWLGGDTSDFKEGDLKVEKESDTWCTPIGNVYAHLNGRRPHDLVLDYLRRHRPSWPSVKSARGLVEHKNRLRQEAREILGLPKSLPVPEVEARSPRNRAGFQLTPVVLKPEKGILLPGVWIESGDSPSKPSVILNLDARGKGNLIKEEQLVRSLVERGYRLLSVDLRGTGETSPSMEGKFWDFLAGSPIFGQRVADVLSILKWLSQPDVKAGNVYIWAKGVSALYAVMAAALDDSIAGLILEEPLLSFESAVTVKVPAYRHEILLPGVLRKFDLPQVYQALCPAQVLLLRPLEGDKRPASKRASEVILHPAAQVYAVHADPGHWRVSTGVDPTDRVRLILSVLP